MHEDCVKNREIKDETYVMEPFSKDVLEPFEWTHVLATFDDCTNEVNAFQLCDENGFDVQPILMIVVMLSKEASKQ